MRPSPAPRSRRPMPPRVPGSVPVPSLTRLELEPHRPRYRRLVRGPGAFLRAVAEIELVDAAGAGADLLDRNQDLPHVLAGLPVMLLKLEHALVEAPHIAHHTADFGMNEVGGLAHAGVLE